jgi:elongation factor P
MYDTSDIRKGLKVLLDGNPYNVVEFQFIKPGKGAAFTRTKFKNLLTGAVIERNIRSGEKLEPANVEEKNMQYLYKEGEDLVFMDEKSFEQVSVRADMIGDAVGLMKDNLGCTVLFFNERPVDVSCRPSCSSRSPPRSRACAATPRATSPSRPRSRPGPPSRSRCSSTSATC